MTFLYTFLSSLVIVVQVYSDPVYGSKDFCILNSSRPWRTMHGEQGLEYLRLPHHG